MRMRKVPVRNKVFIFYFYFEIACFLLVEMQIIQNEILPDGGDPIKTPSPSQEQSSITNILSDKVVITCFVLADDEIDKDDPIETPSQGQSIHI